MINAIAKRVIDILACIVLAPFIIPIIAICAALIKLDGPGPVFFRQERVGRHWKHFLVLKLRTMVPDAEHMGEGLYTTQNDPRFTRIGPTLRRLSLDELPQLYNLVRGEMSLVGPRPLPAVIVESHAEEYETILSVPPGITGLSQVRGRNSLRRSERLKLDMYYATHWSIWMDLKILLETLVVVFTGAGQINYRGREEVEDVG